MSRTTVSLRLPGECSSEYIFFCIDYYFFSMQNDPVVSKASELLRLGLMPSPEELRAGKVFKTLQVG